MSKALKRMAMKLAIVNAMAIATMGGDMPYGLVDRPPRATTEEDNKFVEKQGYKKPSERTKGDRIIQKLKRNQRKNRKSKSHKHGGARK